MSGCHQILTGALNPGDRSFSLGNIDSIPFLAYASGCKLVILSFDFQRVQIIPDSVQISCIHCSPDGGKIAAAYDNKIKIFQPALHPDPTHPNPLFNYRWEESSVLECECRVNSLSWDQEGERLLMGGTSLQMWRFQGEATWAPIWKCPTPTEVHYLSFSPDSVLFATAGKFDRLVKVWYPVSKLSPTPDKLSYDFVYLSHPRAVTGFSWRQTSKYMPKGAVFNALITSCLDKICRIWTETVLPEDSFSVNVNRDLAPTEAKFTRNHKHRIIKRLQHVKACFHVRKRQKEMLPPHITSAFPLPLISGTSLPMLSLPGQLNHAHHNNNTSYLDLNSGGISTHFHLAGSINAETDIPLVPPLKHHNFRLFWLNNKEMFFSQQAEEIFRKTLLLQEREEEGEESEGESERGGLSSGAASSTNSFAEDSSLRTIDLLDRKLEGLLRDWHRTPDVLVSLHPIDGSFLVWSVEWLDEHGPGAFRQAQISFSSCIPGALPLADATSMSSSNLVLFPLEKLASNRAGMMTKHHNGTLNLWTLCFGDDSKFCQVLSVSHAKRASGHRFQVRAMACHPVLPLVLTAASHSSPPPEPEEKDPTSNAHQNYSSELILWRVDPIGPLCKSGGIVEIARINSFEANSFSHVAWVPGLLPSTNLFSNSGCFVASDGSNLRVYQAVLDATNLLNEISSSMRKRRASLNDSVVSLSSSSSLSSLGGEDDVEHEQDQEDPFHIVSQQSTSRPGCILQLDRIDNQNWGEVSFIEVFRDDISPLKRGDLDYREAFHVVLISRKRKVYAWRIEVSTPNILVSNHNNNNQLTLSTIEGGDAPKKPHFLDISITKVVEQILPGPELKFSSCTGHFVCGSSYALIVASVQEQTVKLYKLEKVEDQEEEIIVNPITSAPATTCSFFKEWGSLTLSKARGKLLSASAAYSGRMGVVHQSPASISVSVFECESTGGTEWLLEDVIELKTESEVSLVQLEWIPKHDAQHILALAVSDMICLFAHVSKEPGVRRVLTSSCESQHWLPLHFFKLSSADGLSPFPVRFGWIHAVCVVSMRNEMQVYSQWALENLTDVSSLTSRSTKTLDLNVSEQSIGGLMSGSVGLFQYTRHCFPVLPQYHPTQLMEMLNSGKVRWVRVILGHLVRCISVSGAAAAGKDGVKRQSSVGPEDFLLGDGRQRSMSRSRGLSISISGGPPPSPLDRRGSMTGAEMELMMATNYVEMRTVPPVPLWMLLQAEKEEVGGGSGGTGPGPSANAEEGDHYKDLFSAGGVDEGLDESVFNDFDLDDDDEDGGGGEKKRRRSTSGEHGTHLNFGQRQSRLLSRVLTHTQLPGLSSLDQMHLLALADTVASIGTRLDQNRDNVHQQLHDGTPDSLDECGLRFLIVVRHYSYLIKCLPPAQRVPIQKEGIVPSSIVWAFHSESQEDILSLLPAYQKNTLTWNLLREIGAGYWLRNNATLRLVIEKVAKYSFQRSQDPMDAAIFYLGMKKKTLLWGLYRSKKDEKMATFFSNDFNDERWRKAALKNAYALLGKQRFHHAAAFFLLAGSLKDALEVCLAKLQDVQLALVVARLYDGGDLDPTPESVKSLLRSEIIEGQDPFLGSMALWMLKDFQGSLDILLHTRSMSTRVFNFYVFLRNHPLLVRMKREQGTLALSKGERNLYFFTAHEHYSAGCPALAIHVLSQLPKEKLNYVSAVATSPVKERERKAKLEKRDSVMDFDWSTPLASGPPKKMVEEELTLEWEDHDQEEEEGEAEKKDKKEKKEKDNKPDESSGLTINLHDPHLQIALELKLASCLKLMSEEVVSMASQLEGTELRLHLYAWLERQVPTLKEVCLYQSDEEEDPSKSGHLGIDDHAHQYHSSDLEWKMGVVSRRGKWLRANRHLLATLLAFARLHAHALAPIHIELVFLLDELQREKGTASGGLHSPLPYLHSEFPLLSSVAGGASKTAVSFIQSCARDILQTMSELVAIPVFPLEEEEKPEEKKTLLAAAQQKSVEEATAKEKEEEKEKDEAEEEEHKDEDALSSAPTSPFKQKAEAVEAESPKKDEMSALVCDWRLVLVLRDSGVALSSSLFQALSDSEGGSSSGEALHLLFAPKRRRWSSSGSGERGGSTSSTTAGDITSSPDKWPGVAFLRGLLSREEDGEATPKLKFLLVECYAAIFSAIFVHSIACCDPHSLYRILAKRMDAAGFSSIFGGGTRRQVKTHAPALLSSSSGDKAEDPTSPSTMWSTLGALNKARMKFNMKLLGTQLTLTGSSSSPAPSKGSPDQRTGEALNRAMMTTREKFVPPELSIYAYLMGKPKPRTDEHDGVLIFPDSDDEDAEDLGDQEEDEEDFDDGFGWEPKKKDGKGEEENKEEAPFSYAWRLMRLAAVKLAKNELKRMVTIAGIEGCELSHISPYLDGLIRVFGVWQERLFQELEDSSPAPPNFLKNSVVESLAGPPIHKYRALLDPTNTPFLQKKPTFAHRRLWNLLVREDTVQNYFIRFVFGRRRAEDTISLWEQSMDQARLRTLANISESGGGGEPSTTGEEGEDQEDSSASNTIGPIRIVHKEHESISSFCVHQTGAGLMAIATPKEIQELDISVLLSMENWKFEDQCELDLINLRKDPETLSSSSYLVVHSPSDRNVLNMIEKPQKGSHSLILKHRVDGVRRMTSHATQPLYLSGSQDGSVRLWEFSHAQPVSVPRPSGTFAKVTRIRFHGNKFGVSDGDGRLSLWQIGAASPRPFYTAQCHSKQTSDFVYLGSSSLIASAGMSTDSKNVALWDTLMPMKKAQIASFVCHDQGCVALAYAEEHQALISAGKKGAICIWDIRQRSLRHKFQGHESAIKCLCLDPSEEYFCTGSADGDIKVWELGGKALALFVGEHSRSGFFKNIPGQGVTQLHLDNNHRLFSCGSDGSLKIRTLKLD